MRTKGRHISICKTNIESKYMIIYSGLSNMGMYTRQVKIRVNEEIDHSIADLQDVAVTDISLSRERLSDVLEVYTSTCSPTSTSLTRSASMSMISAAAAYSLDDCDLQTTMHSYNNIGGNRIDVRGLNR